MKTSLTHNQRMQIGMATTMYQVMELLEWNLMTYSMFKYECGLKYLEAYLRGDKDAIDHMSRSVSYWGWWRLHWYRREQEWMWGEDGAARWLHSSKIVNVVGHMIQLQPIEDHPAIKMGICVIPGFTKFGRRNSFRQLNDPVELAEGLTQSAKVLEDSYSRDLVPQLK